jgi:hypothetical protein
VGSKSNTWCGQCPKCLFAFIILSPFISPKKLVGIFGKNLFEKESLLPDFKELIGESATKPFECVGTIDEINLALSETIKRYNPPLPYLLNYYHTLPTEDMHPDVAHIDLDNTSHYLDDQFMKILEKAVR